MNSFTHHPMFKLIITIVGSILCAIGFNWFLIPHDVLSSGFGGLALLIALMLKMNTGLIFILINIPVLILGYMKLPRSVMNNTILCVVLLSFFLAFIPIIKISKDPLVDVIFGGVILGVGVGIILRYSGTTGGMDTIAMIITQKSSMSIGFLMTLMNALIVLASGFVFSWDIALLTLLSIYICGKTIDTIYISHIKLTVNIITTDPESVKQGLMETVYRGMTIYDARGGYSNDKKSVIMMVLTRYELPDVVNISKEKDPNCFINVYETTEVHGQFARN